MSEFSPFIGGTKLRNCIQGDRYASRRRLGFNTQAYAARPTNTIFKGVRQVEMLYVLPKFIWDSCPVVLDPADPFGEK